MSEGAAPETNLQNRVTGLELQLEELVEQQKRATVQGRTEDAEALGRQIAGVQDELAAAAERLAAEGPTPEIDAEQVHEADLEAL